MNAKSDAFLLVVEDSDVDFDILESVVSRHHAGRKLHRQESGEEALNYLHSLAAKGHPLPSVILMDLNLTGMNGIEVVKKIRADVILKAIPSVILSTSQSAKDVSESYLAGANTYLSKPLKLEEFERMVSKFVDYWFDTALLPSTHDSSRIKVG